MLTVYGMRASGNCYKLQLLLEQLQRPYRWVEVDSASGATRTDDFLAKNPNGKVPLLELDDGRRLAESNAILFYLAEGSPYLSADAWQRAQTLQWMFFEQYSHEPYVAVARFICGWTALDSPRRADLPGLRQRGEAAFEVMAQHLQRNRWFSGDGYGIADIALFAYSHNAAEGGFALQRWPDILDWLARVRATANFQPMADIAAANRALIEASHH